MALIVLGINHKSAPVGIRERLAFDPKELKDTAEKVFAASPDIDEKVVLSTCNRVEIYAHTENIEAGFASLKNFLYRYHEIEAGTLEEYFYRYELEDAVRHLFEVSSSLDSMVIGEPQILGQVKEAYNSAKAVKATGKVLNQLFEKAFSVAKKIRTETGIAEKAVSISYAAVELAEKIFGNLEGRSVLLIGAGEMIELAGKHLVSQGVKTILVSNHNYERAASLATELGGSAINYDKFTDELTNADIVISSTAAPHYVIKKESVEVAVRARSGKPVFFIDIAVPRDIEPSINELNNVFLYDIDDLNHVVTSNLADREEEADKARAIIKNEVTRFVSWLGHIEMEPMIVAVRKNAQEIKNRELAKTLSKMNLSKEDEKAIDTMANSIINKMLHDPTLSFRRNTATADEEEISKHSFVKFFKDLFNLEE